MISEDYFVRQGSSVPLTFDIRCGVPPIEQMISHTLEAESFRRASDAPILLLLDAPSGFALRQLEELAPPCRRTIVATNNTCPEYCKDLWELQPAVLLAGGQCNREVETALVRVARGESYRLVPPHSTALTPCERTVLRYVACGWSNQRIAQQLHVKVQSVANALGHVYSKLHLNGRVEAALYYWGRLDLIR